MKGLQQVSGPSKLLDKRWKKQQHDIHKRKLRQIRSTIREQYQTTPFGMEKPAINIRNGKKEALVERKLLLLNLNLAQRGTLKLNARTEFYLRRCLTSCRALNRTYTSQVSPEVSRLKGL